MRRLVVLVFVAGCDFLFNLDQVRLDVDGGQGDGSDAPMDAPGCFGKYGASGAGLVSICPADAPPETWTPDAELSSGGTTNDCSFTLVQSGTSTELCVIYARNITLGGGVPTSGGRPVVFLATDTFTLQSTGSISVDSRRNAGRNGAGANESTCPTAPAGTLSTMGSSGGGGGSFGTRAGNGGAGTSGVAGGVSALAVTSLTFIRGGCRGGTGGGLTANGASGGAVYIIGGKRVIIEGLIDASGEAGAGGETGPVSGAGGGGGGSGGLIAIDSPMIAITSNARLVANGGGGGGGGDGNGGTDGLPGSESQLSMPAPFPAPGGDSGTSGGKGGRGGAAGQGAGGGLNAGSTILNSGGGGGGGGAGIIRFYSVAPVDLQSTNITPTPTQ